MASPVNNVLAGGEEDENPIPGAEDESTDLLSGSAPSSTPPIAPAPSPATPKSPVQVDSAQKVHPHMAILAGLLNRVLGGIQNAPGNPRNAFDRGFMQASPNQQALTQASISQAKSAADLERMQVSITGLKALQLEYLIKRLPQQEQEQYLDKVGQFKQALIKDGASVEATADDEKSGDAQSVHLNATDPRATSHAGKFYSLPEPVAPGKPAKYDVVFVPNKNVLQDDFKWTDSDGKEHVIEKGTPFAGGLGKLVDEMQKDAQGQTKEEHKKLADALGPQSDEKAEGTADYLERLQKENNPLYQQNKQGVDAAIPSLRAQAQRAQQGKERVAAAGAARIEERQLTGKQAVVDTEEGPVQMSAKEAAATTDDFTTLSGQQAMKNRDLRANADASLNALTNYEKTFSETKLSPAEKDAMRQIVLQVQHDTATNKGGMLGDIVDQIPLVGPVASNLNSYVDRLVRGGIQSGSWDALSPKAKTMMTQYFQAVVANFANMKQMLGSVGRNPAMIQAETNTIPLPYLDRQSAQSAFNTKVSDLKQRNVSIPRIKGAKTGSEINREKLWEEEGNRERKQ